MMYAGYAIECREVDVTMKLEVDIHKYKTLEEVENAIRWGLGKYGDGCEISVKSVTATDKGFYHLVPDEPQETQ